MQLLPLHHVNLNKEFIGDCKMWLTFLEKQGQKGICRPFVEWSAGDESRKVLKFFSDASKNESLGVGAVYDNRRWLCQQWPADFIKRHDPSIEFLELYALVSAMITWNLEPGLTNSRGVVFCDNEAVIHMLNNTASLCWHCLKLLRILVLGNTNNNRQVFCKHI